MLAVCWIQDYDIAKDYMTNKFERKTQLKMEKPL